MGLVAIVFHFTASWKIEFERGWVNIKLMDVWQTIGAAFIGVFLPLKQKALSKGVEKCELSGLHNKTFVVRDERWLLEAEHP